MSKQSNGISGDRIRVGMIGLKGLPPTGGGARAGAAVMKRLEGRYDFTVFATGAHASGPSPMSGVRQIVLPSVPGRRLNLIFYYWASAAAAILRHDFDLVHLHHGMSGYVAPLLRWRFPVLVTFHGHSPGIARDERFGWVGRVSLRLGERLAVRFANEIVTVAKTHVPYYRSLTRRRVHWIPNGVERIEFEPPVGGTEGGGNYIAFAAGRIIPLKGCHLLLQAVRELRLDKEVLVMGDMSPHPDYAERVRSLAAGLNVTFTGLIRDPRRLSRLVREAEVFVFPSVTEAMSNMLLEAAAVGAPLLCSDILANRSILEEEEALFFESGSVEDLTRKLAWALENSGELQRRAQRAQRKVEREYSWEKVSDQYDRLYQKLARS